MNKSGSFLPRSAGWIVRIDGRDRAAGPTRDAALATAQALGWRGQLGPRASVRPATAAELDRLDVPPSALDGGIGPWWRSAAHTWSAVDNHDRATGKPAGP